jgi:glycosidase
MKLRTTLLIIALVWLTALAGCAIQPAAAPTAVPPTVAPPTDTPPTDTPPTAVPTPLPTPSPVPSPESPFPTQGTDGAPWWNDTVFYQVFVRSFFDSDGDGVGDLNGLIEKLDYLNDGDPATTDDLGVTGLWLMPIMQSPSYHGYDVVDYYQVDDEYGTNEDFLRLVDEAHQRGMRVIVDMVFNHSSRQHPWFVESQNDASEKRDWYVWEIEDPNFRGPQNQVVWHRTPYGYFYGVFDSSIPDFNLTNQETTDQIYDITRFWLEDMGADGFRLDAIKHFIENGEQQEFTQATHEWFQAFYPFYKSINPDAFMVGEAWGPTQQVVKFIGDEVDSAFEFDLAAATLSSARSGSNRALRQAMQITLDNYPLNQYATFLANHDQDRTLSQLDGKEEKAKVAATLLLTGPGTPFIYYGEEIGQQGIRRGNTDEPRRLPLQWDDTPNTAGFTTGRPWSAPFNDYTERNIAAQSADPDSLLSLHRQLIRLRDEHPALRVGETAVVDPGAASVYALLRHHNGETLLVLANLSARPVDRYGLLLESSPLRGTLTAEDLLGAGPLTPPQVDAQGGFSDYRPVENLEPFATYLILLD